MSIFVKQHPQKEKSPKTATTASTFSEAEKVKAITKLNKSLDSFSKEKNVQGALNISKQVGNFLYDRKNGVPDKIAENKGNALITNILIGIAEQKPASEIITDLRRLSGWH